MTPARLHDVIALGEGQNLEFRQDKLGSHKSSHKSSQRSSQKILDILTTQPEITIAGLAAEIGISDRAIKKHLATMQSSGRVVRIGPDKGGHWEVLD